MHTISELFPFVGFYSVPFIILLFSGFVSKQFKRLRLSIKLVDLIIPYMFLLLFIMSHLYLPINLIPYIAIIISLIAISLATYLAFYKKELSIYMFIRIWWRIVFIVCLVAYIGAGIWVFFL
ncbi:MAG: DUF3397 family protein [Alkalibacterium gilvum]|uniref:DUF3397 family protein n=1 Tax=Alkalibacterium gilvum TaxID=1130080 RepID=UPI003F91028A